MATAPRALLRIRRAGQAIPNTTASTPILDFLLPSYLPRAAPGSTTQVGGRCYSVAAPGAAAQTKTQESQPRRRTVPFIGHCEQSTRRLSSSLGPNAVASAVANKPQSVWQQCRSFSTTRRRDRTETVLNPQMDDDGKEMRLEITSRAAKRLSKVMEKDGNPLLALRIQVESGGCHGFQYVMSLVTLPSQLPAPNAPSADAPDAESEPAIVREDDTIFSYVAEEGETVAGDGDPLKAPKIILDTPSLELLNGSKVDFTMELIGSQFKIVDNPLATSSCGCGTSFDIKI